MNASELVDAVSWAMLSASDRTQNFDITKVELELETVITVEGGCKFDFQIVEIGADVKNERTQTLSLTLVPGPPIEAGRIPETARMLSAALGDACEAAESIGMPGYVLDEVAVQVEFAVEAGGGISVVVKGAGSKGATQRATLTLKPKTRVAGLGIPKRPR